jgi:TonB family protein
MVSLVRTGKVAAVLLGWSALVLPVFAQSALFVEYHGKMEPVIAARGTEPVIVKDGKRVSVRGGKFGMGKVEEFFPAFVAVKDIEVRDSYLQLSGGGDINHTFELKAEFDSSYVLKDVFVVLEFEFDRGEKSLFLNQVGDLAPHKSQFIHLAAPMSGPLGDGKYLVHIFSCGVEVFHSQLPFFFRESMLDQMIAKRIAGAPDGKPQPFIGPPPEYPRKFTKSRIKGSARLHFTIRTNGAVENPTIVTASDPAFGEAALDSIRMWRFLPRIKAGRPIETSVDLPMEFEPPEKS